MRAMKLVCQMLARISPLTHSSSLRFVDRPAVGGDGEAARLLQRRGVEEAQLRACRRS